MMKSGDAIGLRNLLTAQPLLCHVRAPRAEPPYDAYFRSATLLHHVSGNPLLQKLPQNITELARLLLEHGAQVDATSGVTDDWSWTTLGLVASSSRAHTAGIWRELIDLLLEFGADIDHADGRPMFGALYHVPEHRGLGEVAAYLAERGARLNLRFAAGLGDLDRMASFRERRASELQEAFALAARAGQTAAVEWLLDRGAEIDACDDDRVTALHAAAAGDWPDVVRLLLERGASTRVVDAEHHGTAPEWAHYTGATAAAEVFLEQSDRLRPEDVALLRGDRPAD